MATQSGRAFPVRRIIPPADGLRRHPPPKGVRHINLAKDHAAVKEGRTLFPTTVKFVEEVGRVLVGGYNSRKIGKAVTKGPWKGLPIYTLTLQERATCPKSCSHWRDCYGNTMHMANRIVNDADFEEILWLELDALNRKHPVGYVVRLHVLGDFYSVPYVDLWEKALLMFPALHVFGYTARNPRSDQIGAAVFRLSSNYWTRFAIRFSGRDWGLQGAITIERGEKHPTAITCPAQTGKTLCCGTCGLCWTANKTIAFERH
jgi:hypothetical protein